MEKWRSRGKTMSKEESVLPPTRRKTVQNCSPLDKKKDRKWSFGGLFKRISSARYNDASSNDEDITYIPGHMLAKKQSKRTSKMKSKLGKSPSGMRIDENKSESNDCSSRNKEPEQIVEETNVEESRDSSCAHNDSVNSRSSEGSLDVVEKCRRLNQMKARAQAKRDRLCGGKSSSDDDSHRSSQSSVRFRSEDSILQSVQRSDSYNRRTRGARTERYIKRMYRDDVNSGSDSKIRQIDNPPTSFNDSMLFRYSSNFNDSTRKTRQPRETSSSRHVPTSIVRYDHSGVNHLRDRNEKETRDEREKFTWPKSNFRRSNPTNEIYGSLKSQIDGTEPTEKKILPPEPPPRSSKSRVFTNVYNASFPFGNVRPIIQQSCRRYYESTPTTPIRSYNSDNDLLLSNRVQPERLRYYWENCESGYDQRFGKPFCSSVSNCANDNCHSIDRSKREIIGTGSQSRRNLDYHEKREDNGPRSYHEPYSTPSSNNFSRTTCSLPKGVELFSRQRLANCDDSDDEAFEATVSPRSCDSKRQSNRSIDRSRNIPSVDDNDDEAERKRSSKNLEDALSELEAIYNSLRLSDEDLLERAEQRSMEEYRDKAAKNAAENSLKSCSDASSNERDEFLDSSARRETDLRMKDDMAYRRMNKKERPSSVNGQSSLLPQISYLATSPNLSNRDVDYPDYVSRNRRGTPDLTRDDLLFRSINDANNKLKVIEPQPPFGIPIGPVTGATESDYLHVKPSDKCGLIRSLYIPKNEPDVVSDDLAFRNLRKDTSRDKYVGFNNKNTNIFPHVDSFTDPRFSKRNTFTFGTNKKRAVRSLSADLWGITSRDFDKDNDWYNDYVRSTQSRPLVSDENDHSCGFNEEYSNHSGNYTDYSTKLFDTNEKMDTHGLSNNLDINGNRPKSALQQKIQVPVPRNISYDNDKRFSDIDERLNRYSRNSVKSMITESEDSSMERCDSRQSSTSDVPIANDREIEQFTEQEISGYQQLCQDLEKLIERTVDEREEEDEKRKKKDKRDTLEKNKMKEEEEESEYEDVVKNVEDTNSQSEFDEWEKLLNEDYELPVSISRFDEATERDDDRSSSSRSVGLSFDNELASSSSPRKCTDKSPEEDCSSISELGICSNNDSLTDSVYDKFDKLLREVNDVPSVECTNKLGKYPTDEFTMIVDQLGGSDRWIAGSKSLNDESKLDGETSSLRTEQIPGTSHVLEYRTKIVSPSTNLNVKDITINPKLDISNVARHRQGKSNYENHNANIKEEKVIPETVDDGETSVYREG